MGCNKPDYVLCPHAGDLTYPLPSCSGCQYHDSTGIVYYPNLAKTIDRFTTDELLAEIQRRMK